jgi:hypothetical protein
MVARHTDTLFDSCLQVPTTGGLRVDLLFRCLPLLETRVLD